VIKMRRMKSDIEAATATQVRSRANRFFDATYPYGRGGLWLQTSGGGDDVAMRPHRRGRRTTIRRVEGGALLCSQACSHQRQVAAALTVTVSYNSQDQIIAW
jgi:hypothetical protein